MVNNSVECVPATLLDESVNANITLNLTKPTDDWLYWMGGKLAAEKYRIDHVTEEDMRP